MQYARKQYKEQLIPINNGRIKVITNDQPTD